MHVRALAPLFCLIIVLAMLAPIQSSVADLIAYWSLNDGTGTTATNDAGDAALDATLDTGAAWTDSGDGHTGRNGDYALDLDGTSLGTARVSGITNAFTEITITAWLNLDATPPAWAGIFESRTGGANQIGFGFHDTTGNLMYIWNNNAGTSWGWNSGVHVDNEVWTFVAFVLTADDVTFYAGPTDGTLSSATNPIAHIEQSGGNWTMGIDDCCGPSRDTDGKIDDLAIWDQALTEEEITLLWSQAVTPLNVFGGGAPFQINSIEAVIGEATLAWNSLPSRTYSIDRSDDLLTWIELDDSLPSQGETTTFTDETITLADVRRFYRVRED